MASETENLDEPREKPKLGDNCKVYTRRNHKKSPENMCNTKNVTVSASDNMFTSPENRNKTTTAVTSSATVNNDNNEKEINKESDTVPHKFPQTLATEEAHPVSNETSIQEKQAEATEPIDATRLNANRAVKPLLTRVDNRIRINLKSGRPKNEIRELKSKLSNELDQVKSVVRRLEDKGGLLSNQPTASASMNVGRVSTRVSSDLGLVSQYSSRPFRSYGGKKRGKKGGHISAVDKYISKSFKGCSDLLTRLMKHKHGWLFNKPVNVEELKLHDYYDVIKNPMDLGTIKSRLLKHDYKSPTEFAEDVKLTFNNSMTYNPKGHEVYRMAEELLKIFEGKWPAIESDYNLALRYEKVHDIGLPTPTSRSLDMGLNAPTSTPSNFRNSEIPNSTVLLSSDSKPKTNGGGGRAPVLKKPEAKDLHKRDMTSDEKQKLTADLESLPSEKLPEIVPIINKRSSEVYQHDEEIELDIDRVDAETLWELDRFVSNFKRNVNKKKRKAEFAHQTGPGSNPHVSTKIPSPAITKPVEHSNIGAKCDANPTSDQEREGDDAGSSSSSSSSSSDSGSSSSDSESDSSSSNGSQRGGSPKT